MADVDETLQRAKEYIDRAEGFVSDAEFREEYEMRVVRFLQAISSSVIAVYLQNQVLLESLRKQQDIDSLGG